ncbi:hypothetical protein OEB94_02895 [Streptomyces sp. ICN988]|uniref:hypothetical protein n=1 Tax=Streptomyces sp. ICN988 TaxID=2983765 RepID=UPI0021E3F3F1|nr:hypothetical protein [Streptomyces sp. ICN988]MCV2458234.1 hypothetical protein [Streptomyces sp. ICN988]
MHPGNALITFEQEGTRVRAWISASPLPPAASERDHRYAALIAALRQRGLECTVEYGLSDYIVQAELPDGSSLIISPPQEPPSEHREAPESWMVTRHRPAEPEVYEMVYDSEPDGPDAQHRGSVPNLLGAIDTRLDELGVPPRQEQKRSVAERAAGAVLHRAGFIPAVAFGGAHYYRLPSAMTDPAEQRLAVTRACDVLQAEGFRLAGDPALLAPGLPVAGSHEASLGDRLGHLTGSVQTATHTRDAIAPLSELTAPGDGVLQRVVEILDATADWWEGFGEAADHQYANHLRLIAEDLDSCAIRLQEIRNDLTDRHTAHPGKDQTQARKTFPSAPASSRVGAALAPSPSAGQYALPAGPPTESSARAVLPPARPSSAPGR